MASEETEETRVHALWFDSEGCGPIPVGGTLDIRAKMHSSYHPRYGVDEFTVKVMIDGRALGGLFLVPADARVLAEQLTMAADDADAELARLLELEKSSE